MKYPVIMFVGKIGSGKDTAARLTHEFTRHHNPASVTLAAPMKEFAKNVFGFTHEQMYGASALRGEASPYTPEACRAQYETYNFDFSEGLGLKPKALFALDNWFDSIVRSGNYTGRHVLQTLGTEFGRAEDKDVWIRAGLKAASRMLAEGNGLITITDGRFRNEILAVKAVGGIVINIVDPADRSVAVHASELEQESVPAFWYDATIVNDKNKGTSWLAKCLAYELAELM